jgi:Na+/phosphate symporter
MDEVLARKHDIDVAVDGFLDNHARRLESGKCSVTSGMIFVELIMNLRRVANHLRNIAASATSRMPEHTLRVRQLRERIGSES